MKVSLLKVITNIVYNFLEKCASLYGLLLNFVYFETVQIKCFPA
jgi:hypothetical protein